MTLKKNSSAAKVVPAGVLEQLVAAEGRVPLVQAAKELRQSPKELTEWIRTKKPPYRIGTESHGADAQEFVVSTASRDRIRVLEDFMGRQPEAVPIKVLKALLGYSEHETQVFALIKRSDKVRLQNGTVVYAAGHARDVVALGSVARAARKLLFHPDSVRRDYFDRCPERVRMKLEHLWTKEHIVLTIDGGRTNTEVAKQLVEERIPPSRGAPVHYGTLTYVTNYKPVEDAVLRGREGNLHDAILVGGRMRQVSDTYVGRFAEACLLAYKVLPDISLIATKTISEKGVFASEDFEESRFKALMLGNPETTLRCITADSSKIRERQTTGWAFATLGDIDVVITDLGIADSRAAPFLEAARNRSVLVLTETKGK